MCTNPIWRHWLVNLHPYLEISQALSSKNQNEVPNYQATVILEPSKFSTLLGALENPGCKWPQFLSSTFQGWHSHNRSCSSSWLMLPDFALMNGSQMMCRGPGSAGMLHPATSRHNSAMKDLQTLSGLSWSERGQHDQQEAHCTPVSWVCSAPKSILCPIHLEHKDASHMQVCEQRTFHAMLWRKLCRISCWSLLTGLFARGSAGKVRGFVFQKHLETAHSFTQVNT